MDYLQSVIGHLSDGPDDRDLKYAILHLQAATEVLLKVRLMREHWSLVFKNVEKANRVALTSGDFISLTLEDTLTRLKSIAGVELPKNHQDGITKLANERNKLQHYGLETGAARVEALVGRVLDGLLCFIRDNLRPGATTEEILILDETEDLIEDERDRIDALIAAVWDRIKSEIDAQKVPVIECPGCAQPALPVEEPIRCRFCERTWPLGEPRRQELAESFASDVLGITAYDIANGASAVLHRCPECDLETLVGPANAVNRQAKLWLCMTCLISWDEAEISSCLKCGEPMEMNEDSGTVCASCFEIAIGGRD
jgi:hypothetical protein